MRGIRAWWPTAALIVYALVWSTSTSAGARDDGIPEALAPWVPWVVGESPEVLCTYRHDRLEIASCHWPGRLELGLHGDGGTFSQTWSLMSDSWVPLPGSREHWPGLVRVNGEPVRVADRDGVPSLRLDAGEFEIQGAFRWDEMPARIPVPTQTAIINLVLSGQPVIAPARDDSGTLLLATVADGATPEARERMEIAIFRRLVDERPFQIHTRLLLDVSGGEREVILPRVFLEDARPLRLEGPLPVRLLADGRLQLQVRPGQWHFDLFTRLPGHVEQVRRGAVELPLPTQEVWSFDARRELRDVRPEGLTVIDPRQTRIPGEWREFPAFVAGPDAELRLVIRARDTEIQPRDQLSLRRNLWLDFDGGGYTLQDHLSGMAHGDERLEVGGVIRLGRVQLNGAPQFITQLGNGDAHGVEVRPGRLELVADARIEGLAAELPVAGWNRAIREVESTLHLPPGWQLLAASGVAGVETAWLDSWSMLDMFMVLVLSIAALRVWGPLAGLLALLALTLSWQTVGAPQYVWVPLLVTSALVNTLNSGRLHLWITRLRMLAILSLVVVATPFLVETARTMLFPQLEHAARPVAAPSADHHRRGALEEVNVTAESTAPAMAVMRAPAAMALSAVDKSLQVEPTRLLDTALVQTGPGVPDWRWSSYRLQWNGPVEASQSHRLILLSPLVNRLIDLMQVLLATALILLMVVNPAARRSPPGSTSPSPGGEIMGWLLAPLLMLGMGTPTPVAAADGFPPESLLEQLRERVVRAPDCLPYCATFQSVLVAAEDGYIRVFFEISVLDDVAVPLLAESSGWLPRSIEVDGVPAAMLGAAEGGLVPLSAGHRLVEISGPVGDIDEVQLTFPVRPHRLAVESAAWGSAGMERPGGSDRQLRLFRATRSAGDKAEDPSSGSESAVGLVPPFFEMTRTIVLDVEARIFSEARRLSDPRAPVSLDVPLLAGESPVSEVSVREGAVRAVFASGQEVFRWESVLHPANPLVLVAPDEDNLVERWRLDAGTRWHVRYAGIDPVLAGGDEGPVRIWRPLPGERLELTLLKPAGIDGDTLTIDRSHLRVVPGRQATRAEFSASLRSSRGGVHELTLPTGSEIQQFRVDGAVQPFDPASREVSVVLRPGTRQLTLEWLHSGTMEEVFRSPRVDLNTSSVNSTVEVEPDGGRWIVWVNGPLQGPAVLYWGLLVVVLLAALGLSRIGMLPVAWWQWFLLGAGITHGSLWFALPVIAWFLLIGYRRGLSPETGKSLFNSCQVAIILLTPLMLTALVSAVEAGLLGNPDMQIAGNQSAAGFLAWYQDRLESSLPEVTIISVPMLVYRLLMLAWSLWLAFTLFRWLRWGWLAFTSGGTWKKIDWRKRRIQEKTN